MSYQGEIETDSARVSKVSTKHAKRLSSGASLATMSETGLRKYEVGRNSRKLAILINIQDFSGSKEKIPPKKLAKVDEKVITTMLEDTLGFDIIPKYDCTEEDLTEFFQELQTWCYSDVDAMAVVLMSYGDNKMIYTSDGKEVQIKALLDNLKGDMCTGMANKPKIVFINAGEWEATPEDAGDGYDEVDAAREVGVKLDVEEKRICIPRECDFIHVYSPVMDGHVKSGGVEQANIFLTALSEMCLKLQWERLEFCDLLTRTNRQVALRVSSDPNVPARPCFFLSTLTKELYLPAKVWLAPS